VEIAYYPVFRADIQHFFKRVDKWKSPDIERPNPNLVVVPTNLAEAEALVARMQEPIGSDIETATDTQAILRPYKRDARILCAALSDGKLTIAFPINHPEARTNWGLRFWLDVMRTKRWIAHNAAFELIWALWFGRTQIDPYYEPAPFDDSMALARIYHQRNTILSLEDVSRIHLGVDIKSLSPVNPSRILDYPLAQVLPYCGMDAWASARIYSKLVKRVDQDIYKELLGSIRSTTEMDYLGLDVDLSVTSRSA
jgi:hypothetical protein